MADSAGSAGMQGVEEVSILDRNTRLGEEIVSLTAVSIAAEAANAAAMAESTAQNSEKSVGQVAVLASRRVLRPRRETSSTPCMPAEPAESAMRMGFATQTAEANYCLRVMSTLIGCVHKDRGSRSAIRITINFGGAQVSIRERLHASIASGQTLSGRKLHTGVPVGILVS